MFVNEVINEISRVFILKRLLVHSRFLEEFLQVWIHVLQVEAMIRIPAHVADVLEVGRHPDVLLLERFPRSSFLDTGSKLLPSQHLDLDRSGSTHSAIHGLKPGS